MVIRRMFSCMLAFVLCFVCTVSVQASSYSGHKKEIKQTVCSLPVMAVDQMNAEYLAVSNAPYECSARCISPERAATVLSCKATGCIRTSRADYDISLLEVRPRNLKRFDFEPSNYSGPVGRIPYVPLC